MDTLKVDGTNGSIDLSVINVINFESIESTTDLSMTVKQVNDLGSVNVGTNVLSIVGNAGSTTMDASTITAATIKFTSGMENPTTVNNIATNIDASGSNKALTMTVNTAADKTAIAIKGSSVLGDSLTLSLDSSEALTSGFSIDSAVETFNVKVNILLT